MSEGNERMSELVKELPEDILFLRAFGLTSFNHPMRRHRVRVEPQLLVSKLIKMYDGYGKIFSAVKESGKIKLFVGGQLIYYQR